MKIPEKTCHQQSDANLAASHDPIESEDSYLVSKAQPNRFSVIDAPVYTPSPSQVLRPGALDYQRYASHGDRC